MEILLIGNGFDLAHGLPTRYRDFLDFCQGIEILFSEDFASFADYERKLEKGLRTDVSPQVLDNLTLAFHNKNNDGAISTTIEQQKYIFLLPRSPLQELYTLINQNTWVKYFMQRSSCIGENWIDFETEISKEIRELDAAQGSEAEVRKVLNEIGLQNPPFVIWSKAEPELEPRPRKSNDYKLSDDLINFLEQELVELVRALEIYISHYINDTEVDVMNPDIDRLHPDHVLSFNYSNTYERVYDSGKSIAYDYIHGKAKLGNNKDNCNLVLGIDEYLDDKRKNTDLQFLTFKKFYQRIFKSTDSQYWKWLNIIEATHESSTLYIFGHSLDVTDRDVLQAFLLCPYMKTKIFYYRESEDDKQTLGKLIHNLLLLLGQEELIQRTSGANRTIEFIPQTL